MLIKAQYQILKLSFILQWKQYKCKYWVYASKHAWLRANLVWRIAEFAGLPKIGIELWENWQTPDLIEILKDWFKVIQRRYEVGERGSLD